MDAGVPRQWERARAGATPGNKKRLDSESLVADGDTIVSTDESYDGFAERFDLAATEEG